jgi:hypothetical protein
MLDGDFLEIIMEDSYIVSSVALYSYFAILVVILALAIYYYRKAKMLEIKRELTWLMCSKRIYTLVVEVASKGKGVYSARIKSRDSDGQETDNWGNFLRIDGNWREFK